jgi:hypothetical protein
MENQNIQLEIGDEIGFVIYASDVDSNDKIIYCAITEVTTRDGERAFFYQFPDGEISQVALHESRVKFFRVTRETVVKTEQAPNLAICLSDRKGEFKEALKRANENEFDVYAGWDRDTFFVVNKEKNSEYRVEFETIDGKCFVECECKDFMYRKRVCKHIAAALQETMFGINLAA